MQHVCVTERIAGEELLRQDLRWRQQHALEEECNKAARIALDNYNQALVQYIHVHSQMDTQMSTHHLLIWRLKAKPTSLFSRDMTFSGGILN